MIEIENVDGTGEGEEVSDTFWLKIQEYAGVIHEGDPRFRYTYWVVAARDEDGSFLAANDSDLPIEPNSIIEQREIPEPEESEEEILRREHALAMAELWVEAYNSGAKEAAKNG